MRNKLSLLTLVIAATVAILPTASATTITENLSFGGTQLGTVTLTQGGSCNGSGISSTSVCVDVQMTSGTVRLGGPVIGFTRAHCGAVRSRESYIYVGSGSLRTSER